MPHVAQAFFAGRFWFRIVLDAMGEMLGLGLKVRGVVRGVGQIELRAGKIGAQMLALVIECRAHFKPSLRSVDAVVALHICAITCIATGDDAGGELHRPGDIFFNLIEAAVVVGG